MMEKITPGDVVRLSPSVRRITQNNPGLMTGPGTNTYLVGERSLVILDPGENDNDHFDVVLQAVGSVPVELVVPTHAHPDHWPLAGRLAHALGSQTAGYGPHNGFVPDRRVSDGELLRGDGWTLEALYTPGHISDHLSYLFHEEQALFSGDHVMGWSTSIIASPDGNLNSYMSSLRRLLALEIQVMYPAHGGRVRNARQRVEELIAHRNMRTEQIVQNLHKGEKTATELVELIYSDVDRRLHAAARQSVKAHLDSLMEQGQVALHSNRDNPTEPRYELA